MPNHYLTAIPPGSEYGMMPMPGHQPVGGMPPMTQPPQHTQAVVQPQQGRPGTVNLATMIHYVTQKAYTDLMRLAEM